MTLPFEIPPFAWPFSALAAGALLWSYTRPEDHFLKQLWWYMVESKANALRALLGRHFRFDRKRAAFSGQVMLGLSVATFIGFTAASLAVCVGIVQNPPERPSPTFDASKYEIVTDGQTIYARPRPDPATNGG